VLAALPRHTAVIQKQFLFMWYTLYLEEEEEPVYILFILERSKAFEIAASSNNINESDSLCSSCS